MTGDGPRLSGGLSLPEGFTVRPAEMDDAVAVTGVFNACSRQAMGIEDFSVEEFRSDWELPGFELASDTRVVISLAGELVAYGDVWGSSQTFVRFTSWVRVRPDFKGRGIGTYLNAWVESRAQQDIGHAPEGARVVLMNWVPAADRDARALLEVLGMASVAHSWEMAIDLVGEPARPKWPGGITVHTREPGEERDFYRARCESFRDHRGYVEEPFEEGFSRWRHMVEHEDYYDPSLWFKAMDGDEMAGFAIGRPGTPEDPDMAWVDYIGVLRPYRRRGLGLALLCHMFREFYRRGIRKAGLAVDAESLTGATRLYERAGMRVVREHVGYEKELRAGVDLRTSRLSE
jgi:mycothiol synthase